MADSPLVATYVSVLHDLLQSDALPMALADLPYMHGRLYQSLVPLRTLLAGPHATSALLLCTYTGHSLAVARGSGDNPSHPHHAHTHSHRSTLQHDLAMVSSAACAGWHALWCEVCLLMHAWRRDSVPCDCCSWPLAVA